MHKWDRRIPLDAEAIEDEVCRSDLQVKVLSLASRELHALLLYFACIPDTYEQEVKGKGQWRRTLLL